MMVQFLKDTSTAQIPATMFHGNTLAVYREGYKLPNLPPNCQFIEFEKYKATYASLEPEFIIVIGLNRIFNPSNRTELVFEYLQTMTSHIPKLSIDTSPFVGEPWRAWIHYSVAFGQWLGFNYSYVVETDWQHWFYRNRNESVMQASNLELNKKETFSDLDVLAPDFQFYEPDRLLFEYYNETKYLAFEKYGGPKQIIQFMLKHLNNHLSIDFGFDSYLSSQKQLLPDLPIFRFVVEENKRRMDIYNVLIDNAKGIF